MAYEETIIQPGQPVTGTLSGRLIIDEGRGRMVLYDGVDNRMIIGLSPQGEVIIAISKVGEDVFEALAT